MAEGEFTIFHHQLESAAAAIADVAQGLPMVVWAVYGASTAPAAVGRVRFVKNSEEPRSHVLAQIQYGHMERGSVPPWAM